MGTLLDLGIWWGLIFVKERAGDKRAFDGLVEAFIHVVVVVISFQAESAYV
jgi:hypothetical protein